MSQNRSGSCLRRRSDCLGNVCGVNLETEDMHFTPKKPNLVYMDKVFSYNNAVGCPMVVPIDTGGKNASLYNAKLTICQNNCGCGCGTEINSNSQFTVEDSIVLVEAFRLRNGINNSQVTVDGYSVDSIAQYGDQFVAQTANLIPRIQKERCLAAGLPTKGFFLITGAAHWAYQARFILKGTVTTNGTCHEFCLEITMDPSCLNTPLPPDKISNFVVNNLSLPCIIKGMAPVIRFQFGANAQLQNPQLTVNCASTGNSESACQTCNCNVALCGNIIFEPTIQVEVVRTSLFCVEAHEAKIPCQGSMEEFLESDTDEDCPDPCADGCPGIVDPPIVCSELESDSDCGCGCGSNDSCECGNSGSCGCGCNCGCGNTAGCGCGNGSCGCGCGNSTAGEATGHFHCCNL